jgi:hypothetical protein
MIVEPDFLDHWKTQMLVQLSSNEASPLWVLRLWAHCQNRKSHMFLNFPPEALKAVCRFPDHANKLESWLMTSGFIRREDSRLIVHQWDEYNAKLFANWENGKLGGRPKSEPKLKPTENPQETHGLPNDNPQGTDRVDRIDRDIYEQRFALFWDAYPKKKSKGRAEKVFLKLKPSEELLSRMINAIKIQKMSEDWVKNQGQFIPHPATWLNDEAWEDDHSGSIKISRDYSKPTGAFAEVKQ